MINLNIFNLINASEMEDRIPKQPFQTTFNSGIIIMSAYKFIFPISHISNKLRYLVVLALPIK